MFSLSFLIHFLGGGGHDLHSSMLYLLMVWLLGWLWVCCLCFLNASMVCWRWRRHRSLSSCRRRLFPCGLNIHVPLAGLLHVSRDRLVGPTRENFAAGFASEIPGKCRNLPLQYFSAVLGICQYLKHRIGTKKEMKWSISAYNLHFLQPPVNIETKMDRKSSGASEQALHPTSLSCVLQWPRYNWVRKNESH